MPPPMVSSCITSIIEARSQEIDIGKIRRAYADFTGSIFIRVCVCVCV